MGETSRRRWGRICVFILEYISDCARRVRHLTIDLHRSEVLMALGYLATLLRETNSLRSVSLSLADVVSE
ncbi:hypothetical protein POSPLADRAFT_1040437 [Postia placenta MAD-698-R-SB12]|uniref:Uncharacterized protein n=1 Tax=Postia placenta MAD-698-R-SB12 TaxID=670580 RepID=A0A1X6MYK4_9APHY|nr:hypothetical protein POSPLADRAFT_1040437 [Postia placenta MAD-698-R-SB12]OSX61322.1 hypothetical protein POSPLADRAFT_1040437 [Postia placenta MAD-698-R-SB12]